MEKEIKIEGVREGVKKLNKLIGRIFCDFGLENPTLYAEKS